ncbi:MAG TPA: chemotaxis protein CheW [Gemmatimonadaceae bacterium]|jgi:purine-binding chemotaxis protein CheW
MSATTSVRLVTFRLGGDLFAAPIEAVERVLRYQTPRAVPNLPAWIGGVIEYGERIVPVIDLRRRFELPSAPITPQMRLLVLSAAGEWAAVLVDAVMDVRTIHAAELVAPPPLFRGLAAEYLRGVIKRDDQLVIVLDTDRLLTSSERLVLAGAVVDGNEHSL